MSSNVAEAGAALHSLSGLVGPGGSFQNALGVSWESFLDQVLTSKATTPTKSLAKAYSIQALMDKRECSDAITMINDVLANAPDDELWIYCQEQSITAYLALGNTA